MQLDQCMYTDLHICRNAWYQILDSPIPYFFFYVGVVFVILAPDRKTSRNIKQQELNAMLWRNSEIDNAKKKGFSISALFFIFFFYILAEYWLTILFVDK